MGYVKRRRICQMPCKTQIPLQVIAEGLQYKHIYESIYILKWAKALLASAIRCVSSFFLNAPPSPLLAATISPASFSAMLRPFLSRL